MPNQFPQMLRVLLKFAQLSEGFFVHDFSKRMIVDPRTVHSWLEKGVEGAGVPHVPTAENRAKLVKYFAEALSCPDFKDELLSLNPDDLTARLQELLSKRDKMVVPLPFQPDKLLEGHFTRLCGTYLLYRHSLVHGQQMINCDVVTLKKGDNDASLNVVMYCLPAKEAAIAQKSPIDRHEHFVGQLWKFGKLFYAMTMYSDEGTGERRVHTLQFPALSTQTDYNYGIVGGYSANLEEPFAARALAKKISNDDISEKLREDSRVRPIPLDDKEVEEFVHLLDNSLESGHPVMTVRWKRSQQLTA